MWRRLAGVDHVDDDLLYTLISKGDAECERHQNGETMTPEQRLGLAQKLMHPGRDQLPEWPVAALIFAWGCIHVRNDE